MRDVGTRWEDEPQVLRLRMSRARHAPLKMTTLEGGASHDEESCRRAGVAGRMRGDSGGEGWRDRLIVLHLRLRVQLKEMVMPSSWGVMANSTSPDLYPVPAVAAYTWVPATALMVMESFGLTV